MPRRAERGEERAKQMGEGEEDVGHEEPDVRGRVLLAVGQGYHNIVAGLCKRRVTVVVEGLVRRKANENGDQRPRHRSPRCSRNRY